MPAKICDTCHGKGWMTDKRRKMVFWQRDERGAWELAAKSFIEFVPRNPPSTKLGRLPRNCWSCSECNATGVINV